MKKIILTACTIVAASLAVAQVAHMVRNAQVQPQYGSPIVTKASPKKTTRAMLNTSETVNAAFTIQGAEAQRQVWTENFDAGSEGWTFTPDQDNYVTIKLKTTTGGQAYSAIDASDVQSLYMEGPFQVYRRAIGYATSPAINVPASGVLHANVGYSQSFNEYAVLTITASTDEFATSTEVWNSTQESGVTTWRWHSIEVPMTAFAGQQVRLRFTYGPGTSDNFRSGGYMADFAIDGLDITAPSEIERVDVKTGELVTFVDMSTGDIASRKWTFQGGSPAESSEAMPVVTYREDGAYSVTLTITAEDGSTSTATREAFVHVTGEAPVAHITPPATFCDYSTHLPMVAPLAPVQYRDASTGCPTQWNWTFQGATPAQSVDECPWVSYDYQHKQHVELNVANQHGSSSDAINVSVEYGNYINNLLATDYPVTYDLEGSGTFPGTNSMKIDAYAEHFSKPSCPMLVYGAMVYFDKAHAEGIADQIADIGVHLYTAKDGLPDKKVESFWWRVIDLETSTSGTLAGTYFEFTPQVVNDEFFIVVDGLPVKNDSVDVSFAMSNLRDKNTAYMRLRDKWRPVAGFFNDKGSSFYIWPAVTHSVLTLLPVGTNEIHVPAQAGSIDQQVFSLFGYNTPTAQEGDWCRITSIPNELTLDTLAIEYDALPEGMNSRKMTFSITDRVNATTITFDVIQERDAIVGDINGDRMVDVADVNILVNVLLGSDTASNYGNRCDVNNDQLIDISDINALINKLLSL